MGMKSHVLLSSILVILSLSIGGCLEKKGKAPAGTDQTDKETKDTTTKQNQFTTIVKAKELGIADITPEHIIIESAFQKHEQDKAISKIEVNILIKEKTKFKLQDGILFSIKVFDQNSNEELHTLKAQAETKVVLEIPTEKLYPSAKPPAQEIDTVSDVQPADETDALPTDAPETELVDEAHTEPVELGIEVILSKGDDVTAQGLLKTTLQVPPPAIATD